MFRAKFSEETKDFFFFFFEKFGKRIPQQMLADKPE